MRSAIKKLGLRKCGSWGKATKPVLKRIANKASRRDNVLVLGKAMTTIKLEEDGPFLVHAFSWPGGRR